MHLSPRTLLGSMLSGTLLAVSLVVSGCGPSAGTVSGKVYLGDQTLKGGTVAFVNDKKESSPPAEINEDGSYSIPKLRPGEYRITVTTEGLRPPDPNMMKSRPKDIQGVQPPDYAARAKRYVPISMEYSDVERSGLSYTVKPGSQEHDIKLTKKQ